MLTQDTILRFAFLLKGFSTTALSPALLETGLRLLHVDLPYERVGRLFPLVKELSAGKRNLFDLLNDETVISVINSFADAGPTQGAKCCPRCKQLTAFKLPQTSDNVVGKLRMYGPLLKGARSAQTRRELIDAILIACGLELDHAKLDKLSQLADSLKAKYQTMEDIMTSEEMHVAMADVVTVHGMPVEAQGIVVCRHCHNRFIINLTVPMSVKAGTALAQA